MSNFNRIFGPLNSPVSMSYLDDNFAQLETASTSTVSITGAGLIGFLPFGTGAVARNVQDKERDWVSAFDFMTAAQVADVRARTFNLDVTAALQALVDYLNGIGGGVGFCPLGIYKIINLVLKEGVVLMGQPGLFGYSTTTTRTKFYAAGAGIIVDTPAASSLSLGLYGIDLQGLGPGTAVKGVRFQNVTYGGVKCSNIQNFADEGILQSAGVACTFEDVLAVNCLLNTTRSAIAGCIDVAGSDHFLNRIEATPSLAALSSASLYVDSFAIRASNCDLSNLIGQTADQGIYDSGGNNRYIACRANSNWADGFNISSSSNQFAACFAQSNGRQTNNTYSGFLLPASVAQGNLFVGCNSTGSSSGNQPKYGFDDRANYAAVSSRNTFVGCTGTNNVTGLFSQANATTNSGIEQPPHLLDASSGTTIDVTGTSFVGLFSYASPTTVTNFTGGVDGQTLWVYGSTQVTLANNATIKTNTGANKLLQAGLYVFKRIQGVWYELL